MTVKALKSISLFIFLWLHSAFGYNGSQAIKYGEGLISNQHDQEFAQVREKCFTTNGKADMEKINLTLRDFKRDREKMEESIKLSRKVRMIDDFGYSDKKASKNAKKRIKNNRTILFTYDQVISETEKMIQQKYASTEEINRLMFFLNAAKNYREIHLYTETFDRAKDLKRLIRYFDKDDTEALQASNLIRNGEYLSPSRIKELIKNGVDISRIDPPSSPLWKNNVVEDYDPYNEEFYGQKIFPEEGKILKYKRFGRGNVKIKTKFVQTDEKGNEKEFNVTIKLGREKYGQIVASHFARSVGYPAIPSVYRGIIRLDLGKTSLSSFIAQWKERNPENNFPISGMIKEYDEEKNIITFHKVMLEAYPELGKLYYKGTPYRSGRYGLINRRESRAQFLFRAMVNLMDTDDQNIRFDAYRESESSEWNPIYYLNDLGQSFGHSVMNFNPLVANTFSDDIVKDKGDKFRFWYTQVGPNPKKTSTTTISDLKWLARRYARLSHQQIRGFFLSSGLPLAIADLYTEKVKRRINDMIDNFEFSKDGVQKLPIMSYEALAREYPEAITPEGKITEKVDKDSDEQVYFNGFRETIPESVVFGAFNFANNQLRSLVSFDKNFIDHEMSYDLGLYQEGDSLIGSTRKISINKMQGEGQNRFLVADTMTISIPLGYTTNVEKFKSGKGENSLPIGLYYRYSYTYYHSYYSQKAAMKTDFFKSMVPFRTTILKRKMKIGDVVDIKTDYGFSLGGLNLDWEDKAHIKANLLKLSYLKSSRIFIEKYSKEIFEVIKKDFKGKAFESGLSASLFLKAGFELRNINSEDNFKFYQFDMTNNEKLKKDAFEQLIYDNDATLADKYSSQYNIDESTNKNSARGRFFFWTKSSSHQTKEIHFNFEEEPHTLEKKAKSKNKKIVIAEYQKNYGRSVKTEGEDIGASLVDPILDFALAPYEEGTHIAIRAEAEYEESSKLENLYLNISLTRKDNWATRKEFQKDFVNYFSRLAGENSEDYFSFDIPDDVEQFSPLIGELKLQLSQDAVEDLVRNTKRRSYCRSNCKFFINRFNSKKAEPKERLKALVKFVRRAFGGKLVHLSRLRKNVKEKDIWLITRLKNFYRQFVPGAIGSLVVDLYGHEIGKSQGRAPLRELEREFNLTPYLNRSLPNPLQD